MWSTGIGGRPLGCNYPYECADGEWTGPVWGSDSDQGDDCGGGVETDTQTDGRSLAEEGRQDVSVSARPAEKPASQTLDQGQRLLAYTQHAGDKTAVTRTAEAAWFC